MCSSMAKLYPRMVTVQLYEFLKVGIFQFVGCQDATVYEERCWVLVRCKFCVDTSVDTR